MSGHTNKKQKPNPVTDKQWDDMKAVLTAVMNEKDGKRVISYDFRVLPDRIEWADYYSIITEPRCLDDINKTLSMRRYHSVSAFLKDLGLVFRNAMYYNEEGSTIAQDADRLDKLSKSMIAARGLLDATKPPPPPAVPAAPPKPFVPPPVSVSSTAGPLLQPAASGSTPGTPVALNSNGTLPKKRGRPSKSDIAARLAAQIAGGNYTPDEIAALTAAAMNPQPKKPKPQPGDSSTPSGSKFKPTPLASPSVSSLPLPAYALSPSQQQHEQLGTPSYQPEAMDLMPMDFGSPAGGYYPSGFSDPGGPSGGLAGGNISDDQDEKLAESKEMIAQLESGLQKLEGFEDVGWMEEDNSGMDARQERCETLLRGVKGFRDATGHRLADVLDRIPESTDNDFLTFDWPLSFASIEHSVTNGGYHTIVEFDKDMARIFEKARRFFVEGSKEYGDVLLLQRLYQTISSPNPISTTPATNFASLTAGPGVARPLKTGETAMGDPLLVTSLRLNTKDRQFLASAFYKGVTYNPGEYVHLSNPDDPSKPIIGHIFKVFVPKGSDKVSISCCWYFRPEQTTHPADRTFYENEIFKTAQFADHALEDIIEKIGVQFYTKFVRGRPKPPGWYPGWPLYVCDSRWNDKDRTMIRIKNWNSCIPDELRKSDFMAIYHFDTVIKIRRVISPFLRGVNGPGRIGEAGVPRSSGAKDDEDEKEDGEPGAPPQPSAPPLTAEQREALARVRREEEKARLAAMVFPKGLPTSSGFSQNAAASGSSTPLPAAGSSATYHHTTSAPGHGGPRYRTNPASQIVPSPAPSLLGTPSTSYQQLPHQQQYRGVASGASTPVQQRGPPQPSHFNNGRAQGLPPQPQRGPNGKIIVDRSIIGNSGGSQYVSQVASFDTVTEATASRFERDPTTNKLLWFSGPPAVIPTLPKPKHSLSYLAWKAAKKTAATNGKGKGKVADVEARGEALIPELQSALRSVELQAAVMKVGMAVGPELEEEIRKLDQQQYEAMDGVVVE